MESELETSLVSSDSSESLSKKPPIQKTRSKKFSPQRTALLNGFYKAGMKREAKLYNSPLIESASREAGLTCLQVQVSLSVFHRHRVIVHK